MSDDEIEEFSINDRDLDAAFNPTRRRGRQSKEEAIYGMWATTAERAQTRPSSSSFYVGRGSQGIAFVSGGVKLGSKIEKQKVKDKTTATTSKKGTKKKPILLEDYDSDEDSDEKDDDDDDEVEIIDKRRKRRKQMFDDDEDDDDDDGDDDENDDDNENGEKNEDEEDEPNDNDDRKVESSDEDEPVIPQRQPPNIQYPRSTPTYSAPVRDKDFGNFEKHTKGFGLKMLKRMGFQEGRGLGKNLQGRALPIQVVKRQGKGAVGRYGNEDPNRVAQVQNEGEPEGKTSKKNATPSVPQWKKQPREKTPKQKYSYKTFNDVINEQNTKFHNKKSSGSTFVPAGQPREKIIDMTGREQRVLTSYEGLSTKHLYGSAGNEQIFSLEELTHNLDLVIESCEESMIRAHRRRKFDEDTTVALKYDLISTEETLKNEETEMNRLNILLSMINRCEELVGEIHDISDLFFLRNVFDELKRSYQKEYQKYRLWDLAVPVLHQKLKEHLALEWDVLHGDHDHDVHLIEMFRKWRNILEDDTIDLTSDSSVPSAETMDPYHRLIWSVWMPNLRQAILQWDPRHPDQLADCLDRWLPCLPKWIVDNIRDHLIFPRLQREVDGWDPLTDPIPIHSWLHPWLPFMADHLEPLYLPIRTKLGQALQNWQPSDGSARAVLLPWKSVFQQGTWDAFMNKHIVPKLILLMQQFVIDPRQQVLEPWNWFVSWHDMIPLPSLIAILEKSFFPQWHQVLNAWLNTNPDYQEIQRWYTGWRSLLPPNVIGHTVIKEKLTEGLIMIDRRLSTPSINPNISTVPPVLPQPAVNANYEALHNRGLASSSSSVVSSFKDLVANKASENNLLFHPIPNRFFEGKQVYRFGNANIYIDKNVLFLFENGHWMPLRLIDLVSRAI